MHYKAILFDLDGTLLDTLEDLATAANRALDALGLPAHPVAAYRLFVGDGLRTLAERLLPDKRRSAPLVDAYRLHPSGQWLGDLPAAGLPA